MSANDFDSPANIRLAVIRPAADNLRGDLGDLASLRASIRAHGVLQPLLLAPLDPVLGDPTGSGLDADGYGYQVVDGHRRYAAAVAEGLDVVPALVRRMSDLDRVEAMLTTALEKRDLLPSEEAAGYARLVALGRSQRDIAALAGVNQSHISKTLKLADLPEKARAAVDSGSITREQGHALATLPAKKLAQMFKGDQMPDRWEIASEVSKAERAAKQVDAEKKAAAAGLKVFGPSQVGYNLNSGAAVWLRYLAEEGRSGCLPDEHAVKSCHAVAYSGTGMQAVCTDPASHPSAAPRPARLADHLVEPEQVTVNDPATGPTAGERRIEETARQAARDAEVAERRAQAADDEIRRKAFMRGLIEKPRPVEVTTLAGAVLPDVSDVQLSDAVELLPVDADDWDYDCLSDHLADWTRGDNGARFQVRHLQVVYAIALAEAAAYAVGRHYDTWALRVQGAYWDHLTRHGYEMSELERSWLPTPEAEGGPLWGLLAEYEAACARWEAERGEENRLAMVACWHPGITAPGRRGATTPGTYDRCTPTVLDADTRNRDSSDGGLLTRGACLGCGWVGDGIYDRENPAAEDAMDHAFPGWRDLPIVKRPPESHNSAGRKALVAWREKVDPLLPDGWLDRGGPILTNRGGVGTRHVPLGVPGGGYDMAVDGITGSRTDEPGHTPDEMHDVAGAERDAEAEAAALPDEDLVSDVIRNAGVGGSDTWTWECSCGISAGKWDTSEEASVSLDAHMVTVHGYLPVEADA